YAFGGAGPVHACAVADLLGAARVIVPPDAGLGSAIGLLAAAPRVDLARTLWLRLDPAPPFEPVAALYREMEAEARALPGGDPGDLTLERSADLRFLGQAHQLTVSLPPGWDAGAMIQAFEQAYARVYGRVPPGVGVQALQWRLTARGAPPVGLRRPTDPTHSRGPSGRERQNAPAAHPAPPAPTRRRPAPGAPRPAPARPAPPPPPPA